jgi:putative flippase GtrA
MIKIVWRLFNSHKHLLGKYATVGFVSAVVDFGTLFILTDLVGFHYLTSATISFALAAMLNYGLNRRWTFQSSGKRRKQLPVFFTIAILGLLINNNIIYVAVERFDMHYLIGKVIAAAIVTSWNFFGNKYLTFKIK